MGGRRRPLQTRPPTPTYPCENGDWGLSINGDPPPVAPYFCGYCLHSCITHTALNTAAPLADRLLRTLDRRKTPPPKRNGDMRFTKKAGQWQGEILQRVDFVSRERARIQPGESHQDLSTTWVRSPQPQHGPGLWGEGGGRATNFASDIGLVWRRH